jgi:uncharacterized protein YjbJ (UPF0337 family)
MSPWRRACVKDSATTTWLETLAYAWRNIMADGTGDKIKGKAQEAAGKAQEQFGDATDDQQMEAKGEQKQAEGKGNQLKGHAKDAAQEAKDAFRDATRKPASHQALERRRDHLIPPPLFMPSAAPVYRGAVSGSSSRSIRSRMASRTAR